MRALVDGPVDLARGAFENQGAIAHAYGLARGATRVVGDVARARDGTLNALGVANDRGNRVDVNFRRITFSLDELFGRPVGFQKVLVPSQDASAAQPANDVTYLDRATRLTRGGDGALFVFRREESATPLLSPAERDALYREAGAGVKTGTGRAEDAAPEELRLLLKDNLK